MADPSLALVRQWETWPRGEVTSEDTLLTDWRAANYDEAKAWNPRLAANQIFIRAFATGAAGLTALVRFTGWMYDPNKGVISPGQVLYQGTLTTGTAVFGSNAVLNADGKTQARNWREMYLWTPAAGQNAGDAVDHTDTVVQQGMLRLNTLGYRMITWEVRNIGDVGEVARIALLVRTAGTGDA